MSEYVRKMQEIRRSNATVPVPNKNKAGMKRQRSRQDSKRAAIKEAS